MALLVDLRYDAGGDETQETQYFWFFSALPGSSHAQLETKDFECECTAQGAESNPTEPQVPS